MRILRFAIPFVIVACCIVALTTLGCSRGKSGLCKITRVTEEPRATELTIELGLDEVSFTYTIPRGMQLTIWIEPYIDGKLVMSLGQYCIAAPVQGKGSFSESFGFRRFSPEFIMESAPKRCRWELWHTYNGTGLNWVDDPFRDTRSNARVSGESWELQPGQTRLIYAHYANKDETKGLAAYPLETIETAQEKIIQDCSACLFIKVRFEKAVGPGQIAIGSGVPDFVTQDK